jgi:hypothetical protein
MRQVYKIQGPQEASERGIYLLDVRVPKSWWKRQVSTYGIHAALDVWSLELAMSSPDGPFLRDTVA